MKIGVFDSGYGGLTILNQLVAALPQYHYLYLSDNARNPYGDKSFDLVHQYTLEAVQRLFKEDCQLVILACNTASAKALRNIQQQYLVKHYPQRRVLGVIIPTVESIAHYTQTNQVGILATKGTVRSDSYAIEINKLHPQIRVYQQPAPLLVPLVEAGELNTAGTQFFIKKYLDKLLDQAPDIDCIALACTHYPILYKQIRDLLPAHVKLIAQGELVAEKFKDYLKRHPEQEMHLSKNAKVEFLTTESSNEFNESASIFCSRNVLAKQISLPE